MNAYIKCQWSREANQPQQEGILHSLFQISSPGLCLPCCLYSPLPSVHPERKRSGSYSPGRRGAGHVGLCECCQGARSVLVAPTPWEGNTMGRPGDFLG